MNKKLRSGCIVVSLLMLITFVAGCQAGTSQPTQPSDTAATSAAAETQATSTEAAAAKPVEILLMDAWLDNLTTPDATVFNQRYQGFFEKYPNVKITREQASNDILDTKIPTLAAAGELPDVFACRSAWVANFVPAGLLLSLEESYSKEYLDNFQQGMLDDFQFKGSHYGVPWRFSPIEIVYYNTEILKECGINQVPQNYDELIAAVKATKAKGYIPIAIGDKGKWPVRMIASTLFLRNAGPGYVDKVKSGEMKFTDKPFVDALNEILDLGKTNGAFNPDFTSIDHLQARTYYYTKKAAMYSEHMGPMQVSSTDLPEELRGITEMTYFPAPKGADPSIGNMEPTAADWGLAIAKTEDEDKMAAAKAFVEYAMSDGYYKPFAEKGGFSPWIIKDQLDTSKIPVLVNKYNTELAPKMIPGPHFDSRFPGGVIDQLSVGMQSMILGQKSPQQVLQEVQDKFAPFVGK